jgi:hypothetical protein
MFTEDRKQANADRRCLHGRRYKMVDYVEGFLILIVMTDKCSTNSKLLLSRHSLAGKGEGKGFRRLDKLPVVG